MFCFPPTSKALHALPQELPQLITQLRVPGLPRRHQAPSEPCGAPHTAESHTKTFINKNFENQNKAVKQKGCCAAVRPTKAVFIGKCYWQKLCVCAVGQCHSIPPQTPFPAAGVKALQHSSSHPPCRSSSHPPLLPHCFPTAPTFTGASKTVIFNLAKPVTKLLSISAAPNQPSAWIYCPLPQRCTNLPLG